MARKTFISYKYHDAKDLRDEIITALGEDATYYNGETVDSPDLTDTSDGNIMENLKDMMYATSVTILVVSPNMKDSNWIDWELEYTLKEIKRGDLTSRTNGVIGVVQKYNGSYDWLITKSVNSDGCSSRSIKDSKLYDLIIKNRLNLLGDDKFSCPDCKNFDALDGSYIALIEEESFLADPIKYIENAYDKSQNLTNYDITKQV
jgi:hypothetical protein